jgi:hypothetical protein
MEPGCTRFTLEAILIPPNVISHFSGIVRLLGYGHGLATTMRSLHDDSMDYSSPQVVVVHEPAPRPPCQHSEQTVTVPSENGGTRQVTILRC